MKSFSNINCSARHSFCNVYLRLSVIMNHLNSYIAHVVISKSRLLHYHASILIMSLQKYLFVTCSYDTQELQQIHPYQNTIATGNGNFCEIANQLTTQDLRLEGIQSLTRISQKPWVHLRQPKKAGMHSLFGTCVM